ncbi:MAG: 2-oxo acid dehydrogenase subunit E2 [Sandaracinus sp.]|nr:2-oxo acid dehydrogenase subunit E2 [Sandaracinus sp.]MCB9613579.1 2-oxo acid dehydrogenase subunit E2 [Sandaracinus sp.]
MTSRRVPFPPERKLVLDTLHLGRDKPMMHALVELDVTRARRLLEEHRARTGARFSQTAFLLVTLGRALAEHPEVHARRDWRGRLVQFDVVDATTIVEIEVEGRRFPYAHVVRGLERRDVGEVHDELRAVARRGLPTTSRGKRLATRAMLATPAFARRSVYRGLLGFADLAQRHTGSVLVSAVGMFGDGAGFGMSAPGLHDLSVIVGGRVARASNGSDPTQNLCVTVAANHAIVDGAPFARFVGAWSRRVAAAEGLEDTLARRSA